MMVTLHDIVMSTIYHTFNLYNLFYVVLCCVMLLRFGTDGMSAVSTLCIIIFIQQGEPLLLHIITESRHNPLPLPCPALVMTLLLSNFVF